MSRIARFVDTGYWLALTNTGDRLHENARQLARSLQGSLVTTEAVLLEVGNALASRRWRGLAAALLGDVRSDLQVEVVPLTPKLFARAVGLYASRSDKDWSLTDCVSFLVMADRGIEEALAADQHIVQAGFRALLRGKEPRLISVGNRARLCGVPPASPRSSLGGSKLDFRFAGPLVDRE